MGERCDDLLADIVRLDFTLRPGADLAVVHGRVSNEGPLTRPVFRCEAELLLADAEAMRGGAYRHREHNQRRRDAVALALMRFTDTVNLRLAAVGPPTGRVPAGEAEAAQGAGRGGWVDIMCIIGARDSAQQGAVVPRSTVDDDSRPLHDMWRSLDVVASVAAVSAMSASARVGSSAARWRRPGGTPDHLPMNRRLRRPDEFHDQLPRPVDLVPAIKIDRVSGGRPGRPDAPGAPRRLLPPCAYTTRLTSR